MLGIVKKLITPALIAAKLVLSSESEAAFPKDAAEVKDVTKNRITVTFQEPKQIKNTDYSYFGDNHTTPDNKKASIDGGPEGLENMSFTSIIETYGQEAGIKMIRGCFIEQLNIERAGLGRGALTENPLLSNVTQEHATFVATNPSLYDWTGADRSKNPHYSYDKDGEKLLPWQRAVKAGYGSNQVSEVGNKGAFTVQGVIKALQDSPAHNNIINSPDTRIGVGVNPRTGILFAMIAQ